MLANKSNQRFCMSNIGFSQIPHDTLFDEILVYPLVCFTSIGLKIIIKIRHIKSRRNFKFPILNATLRI